MKDELVFVILGLVFVFLLLSFGSYQVDRLLERKALAPHIVKAIEESYSNGWDDGMANEHFRCRGITGSSL